MRSPCTTTVIESSPYSPQLESSPHSPQLGKSLPSNEDQVQPKRIKIFLQFLKCPNQRISHFKFRPLPHPCPLLRVGKPPRTRTPIPVLVSNLQFPLACGNWLTPFDKQLSIIESPSLSWAPKLLCWSWPFGSLFHSADHSLPDSLQPPLWASLGWKWLWAIFSWVLAVGTVFLFLSAHLLPLQGFNKYY